MRLNLQAALILLVLAVGAAYHNSVKGAFLWDDEETVVENVFIRSPKHLPEIFSSSFHAGSGHTVPYYRPLITVTYMIDYHLWGLKPFGFHVTNILLHLLNVLLIFLLLRAFFSDAAVALLTAALFAVHPIHTEVVNYVSCRPDLVMVFLSLCGLFSYHRYRTDKKQIFLVLSIACYVGLALSKETGLMFPLVLVAYDRIVYPRFQAVSPNRKKPQAAEPLPLKVYGFFAAVFVLYALLRMTVFNFIGGNMLTQGTLGTAANSNVGLRLLGFAKAMLVYFRLFFIPTHLHSDYDRIVTSSYLDLHAWLAAGVFCAFVALVFRWGRKEPKILFGLAWFLIGLITISGLVPFNTSMAERYMYLPSIGFFLILCSAAAAFFRKPAVRSLRPVLLVSAAVALVVLGALTVRRNPVWADPMEFFLDITRKTTGSFRANNNVGMEYWRKGDLVKAEEFFRRSYAINPTYAVAVNNVGYIYDTKGEIEKAEEFFAKSVGLDPNYLLARRNLANVYVRRKKYKEALEQIRYVLKVYPYDQKARDLLKCIPPEFQTPPVGG